MIRWFRELGRDLWHTALHHTHTGYFGCWKSPCKKWWRGR